MPFKGRATIVEAKRYYSPSVDQTYSLFSMYKPADAILQNVGFTIQWGDGTTCIAGPPFKTMEAAQEYADNWNNRFGFGD